MAYHCTSPHCLHSQHTGASATNIPRIPTKHPPFPATLPTHVRHISTHTTATKSVLLRPRSTHVYGMATLTSRPSYSSLSGLDSFTCHCSALTAEASVEAEIQACILASPLLQACNLNAEMVESKLDYWLRLGDRICSNLGFGPRDQLTLVQRKRVYQYYLPVYMWVEQQLLQHKAQFASGHAPAMVLGVSAPQGCGKSTLCEQLVDLFEFVNMRAASVSIDDFYLTNAHQQALAEANSTNGLLQYRGNAGSHDLQLGTDTLTALTADPASRATVPLPRYDKSAFAGRGDRAAPSTWPSVTLPVDIVLFEGWMLGFRPQPEAAVAAIDPNLVAVNAALTEYNAAWDRFVDAWLVVEVDDPNFVYDWRLQAEVKMRASGKAGMTDEQVKDFVDRYMPAYRAYLPSLYAQGPTTARAGHLLVVEVDEARQPLDVQPQRVVEFGKHM